MVAAVLLARSNYDFELLMGIYRGSVADSVSFWRLITYLGSTWVLIVVVGAAGLLLSWRNHQEVALWMVLGLVTTSSVVDLLKWLIARARPTVPPLTSFSAESFPSGHAAQSLFVYFFLWVIVATLPRRQKQGLLSQGIRECLSMVLVSLPAMVGFSRVYLGVHWPSDVVAGWAIGLFILAIGLLCSLRESEVSSVPACDDESARSIEGPRLSG